MNEYILEQLTPGVKEQFTVTITENMQKTFTTMTGDVNPLHTDSTYASEAGYRDKVVYGMLTSSFYSTLAGCYLPGKYCVFQELNLSFANPVYIGDTLTISGIVDKVYPELKRVKIKVRITNQDGKTVSRGNIVTGVLK